MKNSVLSTIIASLLIGFVFSSTSHAASYNEIQSVVLKGETILGAFGGAAIEGAIVKAKDDWNATYYNKPVRVTDIVVRQTDTNPDAEGLRETLSLVAKPVSQKVSY